MGVLLCVEEILSGFGLFLLFHFLEQHRNSKRFYTLFNSVSSIQNSNTLLSCSSFVFSYFTNTLTLPVVNGPTEGLALIYCGHFFTAIVGKLQQSKNISITNNSFLIFYTFFLTLKVRSGGLSRLGSRFLCLVGFRF